MSAKRTCWYMFLLGLFLKTQVRLVGYIGISELIVLCVAPFVFVKNYSAMKRDGMMPILNLAGMAVLGCVCSSIINHSYFEQFARGFAQTYATWSGLVIGYHLLKDNILSYRWFLLGAFLSGLLSIFVFQGSAATIGGVSANTNEAAVEAVTNSVFFLSGRLLPLMNLPIQMFYAQCPYIYSVIAPIVYAVFALYLSEGSGRSLFGIYAMSALLMAVGGKTRHRLTRLRKNILLLLALGILMMTGLKSVYSWAASSGRLGENAEKKYNDQTKRGSDILSILISGRTDFFVGIYACTQKPIVGYGPWPLDTQGFRAYFLTKYGTEDEMINAIELADKFANRTIPAHSHIIGYWLEYGILGLPFWPYVLFLLYRHLRRDVDAVPEMFGWFALGIPGLLWNIFFSPYASRIGTPIIISALILVNKIKKQLSMDVWRDQ